MKITCTRRIEWDAAHRVLRHESKCAHLHGHRYVALVECEADQLDEVGRVIDFGVVKHLVGGWVDENWDHATLVNDKDEKLMSFVLENNQRAHPFDGEPTAENIAAELFKTALRLLDPHGVVVRSVEVFETPNCSAKVVDSHFRIDQGVPVRSV